MKTNELDRVSHPNEGPIAKVLHEVEHVLHEIEQPFSHRAPIGIFCVIFLLSICVLGYRLFAV